MSLLLYMVADGGRRGYRHVLEAFWDDAKDLGIALPQDEPISDAAFCNARRKVKASAVRVLLRDAAEAFDRQHGDKHRFLGRRILALDGSKIPVQRAPELSHRRRKPGRQDPVDQRASLRLPQPRALPKRDLLPPRRP